MTLTPFEGRQVLRSSLVVRNAGDGLSAAMALDPVEYHTGDKVFVVLECEVTDVTFKPVKDTDGLNRVHAFRAGTATMVDEDLVRSHLDTQAQRIEEASGVTRLPFGAGTDPTRDPDADPLGVVSSCLCGHAGPAGEADHPEGPCVADVAGGDPCDCQGFEPAVSEVAADG